MFFFVNNDIYHSMQPYLVSTVLEKEKKMSIRTKLEKKAFPMKRIFNVLDAELTHINKLSDANRNT